MKLSVIALLLGSSMLLTACGDNQSEAPAAKPEQTSMPEAPAKMEMKAEEKTMPEKMEEAKPAMEAATEKMEKAMEPAKEKMAEAVAKVEATVAPKAPEPVAASEPAGSGTVHVVEMLNSGDDGIMVFKPGFIKIAKGDTVHFKATDAGHNAISEMTPDGSKWEVGYDGGKVTFDKDGVHLYFCQPHRSMGMWGVIQVGEASNKDQIMEEIKTEDGALAMNSGRILKYAEGIQ